MFTDNIKSLENLHTDIAYLAGLYILLARILPSNYSIQVILAYLRGYLPLRCLELERLSLLHNIADYR